MNTNYLWSKIFVARLVKLGVKHVCISPGSRNTTLIYAFAKCKQIKKYVIIDERTCGFFALGLADKTKTPVCVVITSGTAVAELYPAIIEAFKRRVPLIICSADRPPELHNCGSNQTINQENIFKNHIRAYYNAGVPEINEVKINYLLTITDMVFEKATITDIGPVHINFPFKKPLEPKTNDINISDNENKKYLTLAKTIFKNESSEKRLNLNIDSIFKVLSGKPKGLIIAGLYTNKTDFSLIAKISNKLNYPILADGLSGFRLGKHSKTNVIINYSSYINSELFESKYKADIILRFGQTPTSKQLLEYYKKSEAYKIIISKFGDLYDPSKTTNEIIKTDTSLFCQELLKILKKFKFYPNTIWLNTWKIMDEIANQQKKKHINKCKALNEINLIEILIKSIPENGNLVISNSLPPRDIDYFADISHKNINLFSNRGASGIDGIVSTTLGVASIGTEKTILVTGDLSFYYDINSLYIAKKYQMPLTIILINNQGGGIFQMLPISKYSDVFEQYFHTTHNIDFENIVKGFGCKFYSTENIKDILKKLHNSYKTKNVTVIQIKTNSKKSAEIRKKILNEMKIHVERYIIENQN